MKKKRKKAGWNIKNRKCALCHKWIPKEKVMNKHHLSYDSDYVVNVCYVCHSVIHGRLRFHNPYEKKYGKDFGAAFMARDILLLYKGVFNEIRKKFPKDHIPESG